MTLHIKDIRHIIEPFTQWEEVTAVAVGGSFATGVADEHSDIDLYIYSDPGISLDVRRELAHSLGEDVEVDRHGWESTDRWIDPGIGRRVDVAYRSPSWMVRQIRSVLVDYTPALGNTTCLWDNLLHSTPVYDPSNWYEDLRKASLVPYPNELRETIVRHNHPALRSVSTSFYNQLSLAIDREDIVSANHRVAALLASYFDILFAVNRSPNPGDKQVIRHARKRCKRFPHNWEDDIRTLLGTVPLMSGDTMESARVLLDRFDEFLREEQMI